MEFSVPLQGHSYGGHAILFRKSLIGSISVVSTNSKWFCAITVIGSNWPHFTYYLCIYLPTDYGTSSSHDEFLFVLGELEGQDSLLIAGDFNDEFDHVGHNTTQLLTLCLIMTQ